jgi:hypothetical protein
MFTHSNGEKSQPPRWRLPPGHQELLRSVLDGAATGKNVTPEQRAVVRQICSAPEEMNLAPEDFLIAFKLALSNAANEAGLAPGPERNELLEKMVSACIEEFYRESTPRDARQSMDRQEAAGGY